MSNTQIGDQTRNNFTVKRLHVGQKTTAENLVVSQLSLDTIDVLSAIITEVDADTLTTPDMTVTGTLTADTVEATNFNPPIVTDALEDLSDVSIAGPSAGQPLIYNNGTGFWSNTTPSSDSLNLDQTGVAVNDIISYVGPDWNTISNTLSALTDVSLTSLSNGQALLYDSGSTVWTNTTPTVNAVIFEEYATDNTRTIGTNCGTAQIDCIFIGENAGQNASAAGTDGCIAIGVDSSSNMTSASTGSVTIGTNAKATLYPYRDTMLGYNAGGSITGSGFEHVLIGSLAGQSANSSNTVALGYSSGLNYSSSVTIGSYAANNVTGAGSAVHIGYDSGSIASGTANVCIGSQCGNSTGLTTSAVGYRAGLPQNSTGGTICAIGATEQPIGTDYRASTVVGYNILHNTRRDLLVMGTNAGHGPVTVTDNESVLFQLGGATGGAFYSTLIPTAWSAVGGEVQTTVGNPDKYIDVVLENSGVASTLKLYLWEIP